MLPDRVSNPGPLTYESGALPIALRGPAVRCLVLINRIYHRSPMQTEKSLPESKRIMPERRFTEFPALAVHQRI